MKLKVLTWLVLALGLVMGVERAPQRPPNRPVLTCSQVIAMLPTGKYECPNGDDPYGQGANAVTFIVKNPSGSESLVAKVMYNREGGIESGKTSKRLLNEIRVLEAALKNKNLQNVIRMITYYNVGVHTIIIMENAVRGNLQRFLTTNDPHFKDTINIDLMFFYIVMGVWKFHLNLGRVHGDIKPGNIVVTQDYVPKLIDFDLAHKIGSEMSISGSLYCMAPEVLFLGSSPEFPVDLKWTEKQDVYSLGATYYAMHHQGRFPIMPVRSPDQKKKFEEMLLQGDYVVHEGIRADVAVLISRCLQRDPKNRPTMEDLFDKIAGIIQIDADKAQYIAETKLSMKEVADIEKLVRIDPPQQNLGGGNAGVDANNNQEADQAVNEIEIESEERSIPEEFDEVVNKESLEKALEKMNAHEGWLVANRGNTKKEDGDQPQRILEEGIYEFKSLPGPAPKDISNSRRRYPNASLQYGSTVSHREDPAVPSLQPHLEQRPSHRTHSPLILSGSFLLLIGLLSVLLARLARSRKEPVVQISSGPSFASREALA